MKRILFSVALSLLLFSTHAQSLKIMSYNIKSGVGMDNVRNYDRSAQIIRKLKPDVVAVQELDSVTRRSHGDYVLGELAKRTGMHAFYAPAIHYDGGKYGIGLLSKKIPIREYYVSLPGREEQRALFIAEFERFIFCGTHLSLTEADRMASIEKLKHTLGNLDKEKPVFLAGDFNSLPGSPFIQELQKDFIILTDTASPTFPSPMPDRTIDYIVLMKGGPKTIKVKQTKVVNEPLASDHRPVFVKVKLK
ncbi:endonuclease/exonuclease/phosphatase family protein [Phocaeicola abscessus]|uniref:endonuclease/exonuclease/phosphatase family protein n=1 Tax=Phocaeicola abscessus TaxID=555313 RepID=UPI0028EFA83E|nr:endonuclease/exonuclease/phosphatase family protein [Phocaeicola abscessus]